MEHNFTVNFIHLTLSSGTHSEIQFDGLTVDGSTAFNIRAKATNTLGESSYSTVVNTGAFAQKLNCAEGEFEAGFVPSRALPSRCFSFPLAPFLSRPSRPLLAPRRRSSLPLLSQLLSSCSLPSRPLPSCPRLALSFCPRLL